MSSSRYTLITGNTYPVKDSLKAMGGKWDPAKKGWHVPNERAAEAQALVARFTRPAKAAPKSAPAPVAAPVEAAPDFDFANNDADDFCPESSRDEYASAF